MIGMYDCIVIGGGPGGATAAYHLARAGRAVLLLEKAKLPRLKPCGGGVSPQVARWLPFDLQPAISSTVNRLRFTWALGSPLEAELGTLNALWMVRREVFDQLIVEQAVALGAVLRDATEAIGCRWVTDHWSVDTPAGPLAGRYLIGADGALGTTARALGFSRLKYLPAAAMEGEAFCTMSDIHTAHLDFGSIPNGYQWAFPKADGWSVGTGIFRGKQGGNLRSTFETYCRTLNLDPSQVRAASHPIKLWDGDQPLHTRQALLVGEAACLVDPFTAEGIRPAILSGCLAAESVHAALAGQDLALEEYSRRIQEQWGSEMAWARHLARVFHRLPAVSYRLGVARPGAAQRMAQLLCGEIRYSEVAHNAITYLTKGMLGK
jgi:geranylgeranyl reductase family protein